MTHVKRAAQPPRIRAAAVLGAAILLTNGLGCTGDGTLVVVRPVMTLIPEAGTDIVFDEVVLGRTEVGPRIVKVGNVGEGPLIVEEVEITGVNADAFSVSSVPGPLAPSQTGEVFVRFHPSVPGELTATLTLRSNDSRRAEVTWTLKGFAREPCALALTPGHQAFLLGEIRELTISAVSTHECEITRLFTDESLFEILNPPEIPFVVPAGGSAVLEIQYVRVPRTLGVPVREFRVKEREGTEALVTLEGEPPVQDCFSIFPDQMIFPNTVVGNTSVRTATVRNRCSKPAAVTSIAVGEGFYFFTVDNTPFPVVLPPLGQLDIPVTYVPFSPTGDAGWLYVNTNDAVYPQLRVRLYGEASVPAIEVFPRAVDFGNVVYRNPQGPQMRSECASRGLTVQVHSTGGAPLTIDRMEIDPAGDDLFLITGVTVAGQPVIDINMPIVIPPQERADVAVQFFPVRDDPTDHRGRLLIHHNADQSGSAIDEVRLLGSGKPDGVVTDVFLQPEGPKVDILWVIDDSCSMGDEQQRLITNLSQFVSYADSQNADYNMAVTDTDALSSQAGKFERCFPHPAVIGSDYETTEIREEAFECTFNVGTSGTFLEAGMGAAMRALERAMDPDLTPNINRDFLRDDANLAIVTMSDEDDQSLQTNDVLRRFFLSVKGNQAGRVSVHAIAGPVEVECATGRLNAQPGFRYRQMARDLGGLFFDICQDDWSPVLQQLGLDVFVPIEQWELSQAADPGTLVVTVDGINVPRSGTDGYTYDPATNTIIFHGTQVPSPGAQVEATYSGICRP